MTDCVEIIGAGALAQFFCRELTARHIPCRLHVPQGSLSNQAHHALLDDLALLPWMKLIAPEPGELPALRIFAGTPESFFSYQSTRHHQQATSPLLLLTSWWHDLSLLSVQLSGPVIPAYPRITVESWQGRLASSGVLRVELPLEQLRDSPTVDDVASFLERLGFQTDMRHMEHRFKARFFQTSFAYWYSLGHLSLGDHLDSSLASIAPDRLWDSLRIYWESEPDLQLSFPALELGIKFLYQADPSHNDACWILQVLLNHKIGKLHYFLLRSGLLAVPDRFLANSVN